MNSMESVAVQAVTSRSILRHSRWDALLIALSLAQPGVLWMFPSIPAIAIGLWWNSNTVAHNFIHLPFFRSNGWNRVYSFYLTLLLGYPQTLWRDRHLAHHRGQPLVVRWTQPLLAEFGAVLSLWGILLWLAPAFFLTVYLPGYALGLGLCYIHGYFEHAGGTTSHYGSLYNLSFFNDGYHVEHHLRPGTHWTRLPEYVQPDAPETPDVKTSRWPAPLRWIEAISIESLEWIALRSEFLQQCLLSTHERALMSLLGELPAVRRVVIVGGGMYPRTAILLQRLLPAAELVIVDASAEHIAAAKPFLMGGVAFEHRMFEFNGEEDADLIVIPLSFIGDRAGVYRTPPAPAVLVHDWIWSRRGRGVRVSILLLKRLNLVQRARS